MKQGNIRTSGGYSAEGVYVSYVIHEYTWGVGHALYVRDSCINGAWISSSRARNLDELIPHYWRGTDSR